MKNILILASALVLVSIGVFSLQNNEESMLVQKESVQARTSAPVTQVKEFVISGENFSFTPNMITVKKGDRVKIIFKNTQGFHDFILSDFGVATKQIKSPGTEVLEFTAGKIGTFEYYCSVGTHMLMGMVGTFIVEE